MGSSTSPDAGHALSQPLAIAALVAAALAAACLVYYLVRRPPLGAATKLLLLAGLGVFPLITAGTGNLAGFEATTTRGFCGGCHVMEPWTRDAADPASTGLAARHSRNELFGAKSCYTCHADYGMFGTVATKINGLHHVYGYVTKYWDTPIEEAVETIKMFKPFPNSTCTHCHSTKLPGWLDTPDHRAMGDEAEVGCTSHGCHGPAHPFAGGSR
jgi:cytochrome c-type protein NapC